MHDVDDAGKKYLAVGIIADNGSNAGLAGQNTYLVSTSDWFAWDGEHADHAAQFATRGLAMAAALSCSGPLFRMPHLDSIRAVETYASRTPGFPLWSRLAPA
jgi:hypothetical protein